MRPMQSREDIEEMAEAFNALVDTGEATEDTVEAVADALNWVLGHASEDEVKGWLPA